MLSSIGSLHDRITSGLRFRLTLTYILFFAVLLTFLGVFFRQTLKSLYDSQIRNILEEEWGAVRGYLRIEKGKIVWFYDREDPDEAIIIDRLKQIYLLTDQNGKVLEVSPKYEQLGIESPREIRENLRRRREAIWTTRKGPDGVTYLIREGLLTADDDKPYFIAIGRSYEEGDRIIEQFTRYYSVMLPLMIVTAS